MVILKSFQILLIIATTLHLTWYGYLKFKKEAMDAVGRFKETGENSVYWDTVALYSVVEYSLPAGPLLMLIAGVFLWASTGNAGQFFAAFIIAWGAHCFLLSGLLTAKTYFNDKDIRRKSGLLFIGGHISVVAFTVLQVLA